MKFRNRGGYATQYVSGSARPAGEAVIHNPPTPGQWEPVVVDEPTLPFDPRPAPGAQPDTECDGWQTDDVVVRLATVRGNAHRQAGTYRQDQGAVMLHRRTGTVIFAVMDGVSSAPLSHIGARLAGRAAISAVSRTLDTGRPIDWAAVLGTTANALLYDHPGGLQDGETPAEVERRLGTTIVTGVVRRAASGLIATVVRAGDSSAWTLCDSRYVPLFEPKGGETVSSAVAALPRLPSRITPVEVPLPPGSVLLAGTDGIGDPLGDGTGLVGDLFAGVLASPPPILGFAHAVDFSRDTFDDDRTLLAVWPRA